MSDTMIEVSSEQMQDVEKLLSYCDEAGLSITEQQAVALTTYLDVMLRKNQVMNLTAIRDFDKGLVLHLVDSLLFTKFLPEDRLDPMSYDFLDMGTGAGLPGIPIAIARPQYTGILCDSTKKKITAVEEFLAQVGLQDRISTADERVETLALTYPDEFSHIVVRAMASLPVLLEYAAPLLSPEGTLVISKGTPSEDEVEHGKKVADIVGLGLVDQQTFELPQGEGHRTFLVYRRIHNPKVKLPRQIGYAKTYPLA